MRPGVSLDNGAADPQRPRKLSNAESPSLTGERDRCSNPVTTFFLSRDPDGGGKSHQPERPSTMSSSSQPLSSLQDTMQEADRAMKHNTPRSIDTPARSGSRRRSTIKPGTAERLIRRRSSNASITADPHITQPTHSTISERERTRPVTPSNLPSRDVSLSGSPKSLPSRQSHSKSGSASDDELLTNADETGSQAVLSSGDEDDNEAGVGKGGGAELLQSLGGGIQDSQPELIMPSIKMPSRRPFTSRGKRLGRFKIMVAGRKGTLSLETLVWP